MTKFFSICLIYIHGKKLSYSLLKFPNMGVMGQTNTCKMFIPMPTYRITMPEA